MKVGNKIQVTFVVYEPKKVSQTFKNKNFLLNQLNENCTNDWICLDK